MSATSPLSHHFRAMNCQMAAWVYATTPQAQKALLAVERWMRQVERALSRFLPDSDLSRLNTAAGRPYQAGPLLWEVTHQALIMAEATGGIYDPTIGQDLIAAGYDRSFERLSASPPNHDDAPSRTPAPHTWRDIRLDDARSAITLPPGVQLDLGGIAKGWAADRALDILRPFGPALVDAGGDIAIGDPPPGEDGWPLAVTDPLSPEKDLAFLSLARCGLATSGTDHRRWRRHGRQQHHLIDPTRHQPARTDILTATVIAPTTTEADVFALALAILGRARADEWLQQHPSLSALLVQNDGSIHQSTTLARRAPAFFPAYAAG